MALHLPHRHIGTTHSVPPCNLPQRGGLNPAQGNALGTRRTNSHEPCKGDLFVERQNQPPLQGSPHFEH